MKQRWRLRTTSSIVVKLSNAMKYTNLFLKPESNVKSLFFPQEFVNSYDCGSVVVVLFKVTSRCSPFLPTRKWKNLEFFFNIGEGG